MNFNNIAIGTDIEETQRFKDKTLEKDTKFLEKIFTPKELEYCFSKVNPHLNLCGRYCAKEAIVKALCELGIKDVFYKDIEITNKDSGQPVCKINKHPEIQVKLSISHCKNYAVSSVICLI